jgi:hypothetical protein
MKTSSIPSFGRLLWMLALVAGCFIPGRSPSQYIPGLEETNTIHFHEMLSTRFKAGDTNVPILRMDSFRGGASYFCSVEASGKIFSGFSGPVSNSTDWNRSPLTGTNISNVIAILVKLPTSPTEPIPLNKQMHVSGVRSNQYFHFVYDNQKPPAEVRDLCRILGVTMQMAPEIEKKPANIKKADGTH